MFHNQKLNKHINCIHERALIIVYQDHNSTFYKLFLQKTVSFKIHDRNLQNLLIEIFKIEMKLAPEIMTEIFSTIECQYLLRNELIFKLENICTLSVYLKQLLLLARGYVIICPVN